MGQLDTYYMGDGHDLQQAKAIPGFLEHEMLESVEHAYVKVWNPLCGWNGEKVGASMTIKRWIVRWLWLLWTVRVRYSTKAGISSPLSMSPRLLGCPERIVPERAMPGWI